MFGKVSPSADGELLFIWQEFRLCGSELLYDTQEFRHCGADLLLTRLKRRQKLSTHRRDFWCPDSPWWLKELPWYWGKTLVRSLDRPLRGMGKVVLSANKTYIMSLGLQKHYFNRIIPIHLKSTFLAESCFCAENEHKVTHRVWPLGFKAVKRNKWRA